MRITLYILIVSLAVCFFQNDNASEASEHPIENISFDTESNQLELVDISGERLEFNLREAIKQIEQNELSSKEEDILQFVTDMQKVRIEKENEQYKIIAETIVDGKQRDIHVRTIYLE